MTLFYYPLARPLNTNGKPLSGAKLRFYLTQTTTLATVYEDADRETELTNPVVADSAGVFPEIHLDPAVTYRVQLLDAAGQLVPGGNDVDPYDIGAVRYLRTEAESAAGVTPVNLGYPEGVINRYGTNADPGTTDMTAAIQAAVNVAHAKGTGGEVYGLAQIYRTTEAIVFPLQSVRIKFHCARGAVLQCDHNGNGIDWVVENENYSGHVIEGWTITGPNTFLPEEDYEPPSTGVGINLNRNATTNICTGYNNVIRDVVVQGFLYGIDMQAVIGLNVFGSWFRYNQYGVRIGGGQTNANHFFGTHIRENRKHGVSSTGNTGGDLTNATACTFHGCLIETNIPYPFASGGDPPDDSVGVYLANTYAFIFDACYIENHSAAVYLTQGSKSNQFLRCYLSPGGSGTRLSQIVLDGAGIWSNIFDLKCSSSSATEVSVTSNSASQLYNEFKGEGINFISGSLTAQLDYHDIKPSLVYSPARGIGLIRMPSQGYQENVSEGSDPGEIDTMGGSGRTLNMKGIGQLQVANGLTANTVVSTISGLLPHSFFTILNYQTDFTFSLLSGAGSGNIVLQNQRSIEMNKLGQQITFYVNGLGRALEVGRNFSNRILGAASVSGASTNAAVTLSAVGLFNEPDTSYRVNFWVESITGTPAAGSWNAYASSLATTGFTLNVQAAPGVGNTVNFGFELIKLDS